MCPWPVSAKKADVIVSNMVLQYLPNIYLFAEHAATSLKQSGAVVFSIDHPAHALVMRTARLAGFANTKFFSDVPYMETAQCKKRSLWDQAELSFFHRPLSEYIDAFFSHGFLLTHFREVANDEPIGNTQDSIPRIAVFRFVLGDR